MKRSTLAALLLLSLAHNAAAQGTVVLRLPDDTDRLGTVERNAIGDFVRRCWATDPALPELDKFSMLVQVTTDARGVIQTVAPAPMEVPQQRAEIVTKFAARASRAIMDCRNIPLPASALGRPLRLTFRFSP